MLKHKKSEQIGLHTREVFQTLMTTSFQWMIEDEDCSEYDESSKQLLYMSWKLHH
jgi:hypothetical protein